MSGTLDTWASRKQSQVTRGFCLLSDSRCAEAGERSVSVFISSHGSNKLPQRAWLTKTQVYHLIFLEAGSSDESDRVKTSVSRAVFLPEILEENTFPCLF